MQVRKEHQEAGGAAPDRAAPERAVDQAVDEEGRFSHRIPPRAGGEAAVVQAALEDRGDAAAKHLRRVVAVRKAVAHRRAGAGNVRTYRLVTASMMASCSAGRICWMVVFSREGYTRLVRNTT